MLFEGRGEDQKTMYAMNNIDTEINIDMSCLETQFNQSYFFLNFK